MLSVYQFIKLSLMATKSLTGTCAGYFVFTLARELFSCVVLHMCNYGAGTFIVI